MKKKFLGDLAKFFSIHQHKRHVSFLTDSKNVGSGTAATIPGYLADLTDLSNRSNTFTTESKYDAHVNLNLKKKNIPTKITQHFIYQENCSVRVLILGPITSS